MDMALVTLFGKDLTGYCDGFSSNRPTELKHTLKYSILNQFTGDKVSIYIFMSRNAVALG